MKSNNRYFGKWNQGTGITMPERFLTILEFQKDGKKVKDKQGKDAEVLIWLNSNNDIEIANQILPRKNLNGIVIQNHSITVRSKSYGIIIPYSIIQTYKLLNRKVVGFTITCNEFNHLVFLPLEKRHK
ncbi:MAG: hypothetical protein ACT4N5_01385 [Nitrosopumilaceae archaeon]